MKKLLFIGMSLNMGGAEKSLVNLLNLIDYSRYSVDLLLFQKKGVLLQQIPSEVNILDNRDVRVLYQSINESLKNEGYGFGILKQIVARYFFTLYEKLKWKQFDRIRIHRWIDCYSRIIPSNHVHYDVAVAYAGGESAYYMLDKVDADKKVYYFHSDYSQIDIDAELEGKYVDRADMLVTISDECVNSLKKLFPEKADDIVKLGNLSPGSIIIRQSEEFVPDEFIDAGCIKLVSVGRLHEIKGYDMAVEAAKILKESGISFKWVIVGEGDERAFLEKQISEFGLEKEFILAGLKSNPYPYIKNADILLQTSRFEGKSVVIDEARILNTPVIITDYNSSHDQVVDHFDGLIVGMDPESISHGIIECVNDPGLLQQISRNAASRLTQEDPEQYMQILTA